jgi:hypothetical protein
VILVVQVVRNVVLWLLGGPAAEVTPHPLFPGEPYQIFLSWRGPLRLRSLTVALVCEEEATYRQGTDTRKETRRVHYEEVARQEGLLIDRDFPWEFRHQSRLPAGAMHSFEAGHNKVSWMIRVEGDVPGRPRLRHDFPLAVYPPRGQGGGR